MNLDNKRFGEDSRISPVEESYALAMSAFREDNYRECLRLLTSIFNEESEYKPAYELAIGCLERLEALDEAKLFMNACGDFENYKVFYDLGYYYMDVGQNRLAVPFLKRALGLSEGNTEVAIELSVAYTSQFEPEKGFEVLKGVDLGRDFWAWYQYYWCGFLTGKKHDILKFIKGARASFDKAVEQEDSDIAALYYMLDKLQQCVDRYSTIKDIQPIIMHWHYIQYGAAILDCFDNPGSENALEVAGGRYVAKFGAYNEVKKIIYKLKTYIEKLEFLPMAVCYLPDKDSEILGRVLAKAMNIPCREYCNQKIREKHIVIAADNRDFNVCPELAVVKKNEITFAFNHHWLENSLITPDISGLMSQMYVFPWQGDSLKINEETNTVEKTEGDEKTIEEIVKTIEKEVVEEDSTFEEVLQFYYDRKEYLKSSEKGGRRMSFNTDSPVKGACFY